jgi:threonine dehydrogenase-like Zn-dependent dehydrogenase
VKRVGKGLEAALGAIYGRIPPSARPFLKSAFIRSEIRLRGAASRRRVRRGNRIAFLDFEIAHLEAYEYLGPASGDVEVSAVSSTVSPGTECAVLCGLPGARRSFPYFPGYSLAGEVVGSGSRVKCLKTGDRVAGRLKHASGESVNADLLFRIPDGVGYEEASFIELGIIALQGIRKAAIRPGDRVAILGQGVIGQLANRISRLLGASEVIALAASRRRAATALAPGGADRFEVSSAEDFDPRSIAADVVIEAVGTPDAISLAANCARAGGRVVLLGSSRGLSRNVDLAGLILARRLEIVGAHISNMAAGEASPGRHTYRQEGVLFLDLLREQRLDVRPLITWRPKPEDCNAVYEVLAKGGRDQVAIVFDWRQGGVRA